MPCYHPLTGFYSSKVNEKTGKRSLVFSSDQALLPIPQVVPCGRCIGCRLDRSLQWALRCVHEASLYDDNCFITLTFNDANLAPNKGLNVADFQKFMKRLRQKISPQKVRFFHCGEYGLKFSRPHHHACLFGFDFPDKVLWKDENGSRIFVSAMLQELWPFGFCTVGDVTFESAAYVARYVMKKWSKENLEGQDLHDAMSAHSLRKSKIKSSFVGDSTCASMKDLYYDGKKEEYITMSRRPGIGDEWYKKFKSDVFPSGFAVTPNGVKVKLPKYYDYKYELDNLSGYVKLKKARVDRAAASSHNSPARLAVREELKKLQSNQLKRGYEYGD